MIELRTHYLVPTREHKPAVRCGQPLSRNWTIDPEMVTCENCKKLMAKELKS